MSVDASWYFSRIFGHLANLAQFNPSMFSWEKRSPKDQIKNGCTISWEGTEKILQKEKFQPFLCVSFIFGKKKELVIVTRQQKSALTSSTTVAIAWWIFHSHPKKICIIYHEINATRFQGQKKIHELLKKGLEIRVFFSSSTKDGTSQERKKNNNQKI